MTPNSLCVLFDLDGTLVDSAPDLGYAANLVRESLGLAHLPLADYRSQASNGARGLLKVALNIAMDHPDYEDRKALFLKFYEANLTTHSHLFDGVVEMLAALDDAGVPWGIVTNKAGWLAQPVVEQLGFAANCKTLISAIRRRTRSRRLTACCWPPARSGSIPRLASMSATMCAMWLPAVRPACAPSPPAGVTSAPNRTLPSGRPTTSSPRLPTDFAAEPEARCLMSIIPADYTPRADLLAGRTILVTGAGSALPRHGAGGGELRCHGDPAWPHDEKAGSGLRRDRSRRRPAGGDPADEPVSATWADLFEVAEMIEREFGKLDGPGPLRRPFPGFTPMTEEKPKDWMDGLQVNLTAAYSLTRHCLPLMQQTRDASIVFVTDAVGREPKALRGSYGVAKYALEGLVKGWSAGTERHPGPADEQLRPGCHADAAARQGLCVRGSAEAAGSGDCGAGLDLGCSGRIRQGSTGRR